MQTPIKTRPAATPPGTPAASNRSSPATPKAVSVPSSAERDAGSTGGGKDAGGKATGCCCGGGDGDSGDGRCGTEGGDAGGEGGREGGGMGGKIGSSTLTSMSVPLRPRSAATVERTKLGARLPDRRCCASTALPCCEMTSAACAPMKLVLVTATPLLASRLAISASKGPVVSERLKRAVPAEVCNSRTFATSTVLSLSIRRRDLPSEASTQSGETR